MTNEPETVANVASAEALQPIVIPPLTAEEEGEFSFWFAMPSRESLSTTDAIIHARITNDERFLRRVLKKFHNYTALAYSSKLPQSSTMSNIGTIEDAREAFLVELASFHLSLKKSVMICEAEARQVEEYQREKQRIGK
jgi:THO complex subunit 7